MTERVTIEQGGIKLVVSGPATVRQGMVRSRLKYEAKQAKEKDFDRALLRSMVYPDLIAATIEAEGVEWPLGFDAYLELPETLGVEWEEAVYRLNPHWIPPEKKEGEAPDPKASS